MEQRIPAEQDAHFFANGRLPEPKEGTVHLTADYGPVLQRGQIGHAVGAHRGMDGFTLVHISLSLRDDQAAFSIPNAYLQQAR